MDMQLTAGRNFSKEYVDSASVILNETAAKQIGWKNPVGQYLDYPGGNYTRFKVIGVVKDFNIESLRAEVAPFALFHHASQTYQEPQSFISIKIKAGNINKTITSLEKKWKTFAPGKPLDYSFLDDRITNLYRSEQQMGRVFIAFASLAIFIACLGLFGLAAFMAEQRTKEIGIRKVLGASVRNIVTMLSQDFIKLVIIAAVIAFPLAWWGMSKWLEDFAYRIDIQWWMFALAGVGALAIALLTVSFQAIRAAMANPVESLKNE
jgi:putative ABC transport system permease protein